MLNSIIENPETILAFGEKDYSEKQINALKEIYKNPLFKSGLIKHALNNQNQKK